MTSVQLTYVSHKEVQRVFSVNRQHMVDMFMYEYKAVANILCFVRWKFILIGILQVSGFLS